MRDKFEYTNLESLCSIIGGGTPSKSKDEFYGGKIPWATVRDMKSDILNKTELSISEKGLNNSSTNIIPSGNVVIATRVGLGKVSLLNQDTAINQDLKGIIPKNHTLPKYIFWWFKSIKDYIINEGTGATVQGVKLPFIRSLQIPNFTLKEQKQIVALLDKAFAAIDQAKANLEKNIKNAKELFQSKLNEIFSQKGDGWEEKYIEEVSTIVNGYSFKSKDFSSKNDVKSIKITNVGIMKFIEEKSNNLPLEFLQKHTKVIVSEGNLVLALTRTIISKGLKVARVPESYHNSLLNQRVAAIIPDTNIIDNDYLYYYFSSEIVYNYVLKNVNTLMQPNLSIGDLKKMTVPITTLEGQKIISIRIEKLSKNIKTLIKSYRVKLNDMAVYYFPVSQGRFSRFENLMTYTVVFK